MTAQTGNDAWVRLGLALERRRVELDTRYRNRTLFAEERGIDYRLSYDVETGARTNYRRSTRRAIEVAYGLAAGAIDTALAGGGLTVNGQPSVPAVDADEEALRRRLDGLPLTDAEKEGLLTLFRGILLKDGAERRQQA